MKTILHLATVKEDVHTTEVVRGFCGQIKEGPSSIQRERRDNDFIKGALIELLEYESEDGATFWVECRTLAIFTSNRIFEIRKALTR